MTPSSSSSSYDHDVFQHAQKRANQIMLSSLASDLKPEGWIAGGDECKYCPFTKACRALRGDVPDVDKDNKADPQFIAEMIDLAQQERALADDVEAIRARAAGGAGKNKGALA